MRRPLALLTLLAAAALAAPGPAAPKSDDVRYPISAIAAGEGGVWAWLNTYELVRLDPRTNRITARTHTGSALITDLAVGEGGIWGSGVCGRANCRYGVLLRFDPRTGRQARPLTRLGLRPRGVAAGHGSVWVLGGRRVLRIDPRTRRLAGPPITVGRNARDIAVGAGAVWVTTGVSGRHPTGAPRCDLVGIDPRRAAVFRRQQVPCGAGDLAARAGGIWATAPAGAGGLVRFRPRGARLRSPRPWPGGGEAVDVTLGAGLAWALGMSEVVAGRDGWSRGRVALRVFDLVTGGERPASLALGRAPAGLPRVAFGAGAVWVANVPSGTITRVAYGPVRVVARVRPPPRAR